MKKKNGNKKSNKVKGRIGVKLKVFLFLFAILLYLFFGFLPLIKTNYDLFRTSASDPAEFRLDSNELIFFQKCVLKKERNCLMPLIEKKIGPQKTFYKIRMISLKSSVFIREHFLKNHYRYFKHHREAILKMTDELVQSQMKMFDWARRGKFAFSRLPFFPIDYFVSKKFIEVGTGKISKLKAAISKHCKQFKRECKQYKII